MDPSKYGWLSAKCTVLVVTYVMLAKIILLQYYTKMGNTRYVDLGLQTHRIKCRVHDDFK